ncbi:MAG: SigB/SigF/SigG family RNA polymerase sigma factor [bacterium]|nr:SigB/SigF/SigG family RNA polymerase sigma factor [bacterium]
MASTGKEDYQTEDKEAIRELFIAYKTTGDNELRDRLILLFLNLVHFLAKKFAYRGEALEDLVQVGTIGLIKAIDRYDLGRGVEVSTYATPTIVGEIKRYFRDKGWALKVPRRLQELNMLVSRKSEELAGRLGHSPTPAEIAKALSVTEEEVLEAAEMGQVYNVLSLEAEVTVDSEKNGFSLLDYIGEKDPQLERIGDITNLKEAMMELTKRERIVIYLRFYENLSQIEIAKRLGMSQMHVSRIQHKALDKLRLNLDDVDIDV